MQPHGPAQNYSGAPGGPPLGGQPPGMPGGMPFGPPSGFGPRPAFPIARIGAAVTLAAGLIVLFCSLLNLYTVTVTPSAADTSNYNDIPSGTVDVGIGFYNVAPLPAPVTALAIPLLMLVAALTALPGVLGRGAQGALVSAVAAIASTLLSLVLMIANPLPSVELSGKLATDFSKETNFSSIDDLVSRVVDVGPGAGLIIALIVGLLGSVGAVLSYLQIGAHKPAGAPGPVGPVPPAPGAPYGQPGMGFTGQMPRIVDGPLQPGQPGPGGPGNQPGAW